MRIPERLQPLVDDGLVQEVVQPLMSGKEAMLFVVHANGDYCVAKVYKEAHHRSFRHRAGYAEGRRVRNSRQRRAMEKGTKYGKAQLEAAWQNAEVEALYRLSDAGVRVPKPHMYTDGVLLMDLVLSEEGQPAPRLIDIDFTPELARQVHAFLVRQVVLMLCAGLVHGDLSECNVLLAWDGPVIIDLPQATDAAHNPNAMTLFVRDVDNFTRYLARFAPELGETAYGREIWGLYERSQLFPDTPLTGVWRGSTRKADTRAVLREIEDAAREAQLMRAGREGDGDGDGGRSSGRGRRRGPTEGHAGARGATPAPKPTPKPTPKSAPKSAKPAPKPTPRPSAPPTARKPPAKPQPAPQPAPDPPRPGDDFDVDDLDALLSMTPSPPEPRRRR